MSYRFDAKVLTEIVRMHLDLPIEAQLAAVSRTLEGVYGEHVSPGQRWTFSNAGGIMCAISPLHVSTREYLLFCGTPIGTEGHSGRHRADMTDIVMAGEVWTFETGSFERTVYKAGDVAELTRGRANGSKLRPGTWLLEYARGNIGSLFPFALADTVLSTLDFQNARTQLALSTRLMAKSAYTRLKEAREERPFEPNLTVLQKAKSNGNGAHGSASATNGQRRTLLS